MQGGGITWKKDGELLEWCMACYHDNFGAEWLAPFANNFVPSAPSFDEELEALLAREEPLVLWFDLSPHSKEVVIAPLVEQDLQRQEEFWQEVTKESKADAQRHIANSLEALAHEGLGLEEATGAGKKSWQGQEEEEEGAKEKMPDTMASAATGAATPAARKASAGGAKGLASPAKKGSPTKLASKCRGHPMPRYEAPMQQDFSDKELARLLAPRRAEAVVDTGVEAGVVLKEIKGKATVDLAIRQVFKEEWGACDKCWANNNPEGCWYPICTPPCFRCMAMKRLGTLDGAKTHEHGNAPNPTVEKTYHQAMLERGSGKHKCKASPPLSPMDKEKKRVRVVSPAAVTLEVESEGDEEDKACRLGAAIEASKVAPGVENLASPSRQAEAPQDVGALQEEMEQEEEEAKVRPEAAPRVQPWGWKTSPLPESWEPKRRVTARSVEMLHDYQEDVTQALDWQEENNVQEGDLLPLHKPSLPSDDD
ncbi:hypothetical protein C0993_008552 [Termitomyces sp. T159_Od127]|nr:hypothetical protein C0993_008552 [Termitomyces sp. T159_Od127]